VSFNGKTSASQYPRGGLGRKRFLHGGVIPDLVFLYDLVKVFSNAGEFVTGDLHPYPGSSGVSSAYCASISFIRRLEFLALIEYVGRGPPGSFN